MHSYAFDGYLSAAASSSYSYTESMGTYYFGIVYGRVWCGWCSATKKSLNKIKGGIDLAIVLIIPIRQEIATVRFFFLLSGHDQSLPPKHLLFLNQRGQYSLSLL